jgi:hypothetical protein
MTLKPRIRAVDVIRDIRSGMSAAELMKKYTFSSRGLHVLFRKLLEAKAMTKDELENHSALYQVEDDVKGVRRSVRKRTVFLVHVYDAKNPSGKGVVRDVSEKGLCIEGIQSSIGEVKSLIIRTGAFGSGTTAVFDAKCRWVNRAVGPRVVAGFEITSISTLDSTELRKLIPH